MSALNYEEWNEAIGRSVFSPQNAQRPVRLAVDPLSLQAAAREGKRPHWFGSPDEAAEDFVQVVREEIDRYGWRWCETRKGEIPLDLARLALQVLAVFEMDQGEKGGPSYWAALRKLMGKSVERRGTMPDELGPKTHKTCWSGLTRWANDVERGQLGRLPEGNQLEGYEHVRWPMSHGLLRKADVEQLDRFFGAHRDDFSPGEELPSEDLVPLLKRRAASFHAHARRAFRDERLPLAANQVANALTQWDGTCVDLKRGAKAHRVWLSVHGRGSDRLCGGLSQVAPRQVSQDVEGVALTDVFGAASLNAKGAYRPINSSVLLAVCGLDGRYWESRHARPGERVIVARRRSSDEGPFIERLRCISVRDSFQPCGPSTEGAPPGWTIVALRLREDLKAEDLPKDLQGRVRFVGPRVRLRDGLVVRRRWMEGAGPTLEVVGDAGGTIIVDGHEHLLVDGRLVPEHCPTLNQTGDHEAWLPGRYRERARFVVEAPLMARFASPIVAAGWRRSPGAWPELVGERGPWGDGARGPALVGAWPPVRPTEAPPLAIAPQLARIVRQGPTRPTDETIVYAGIDHSNLLVRQLARAAAHAFPGRGRP